jgi:hypothetical protein
MTSRPRCAADPREGGPRAGRAGTAPAATTKRLKNIVENHPRDESPDTEDELLEGLGILHLYNRPRANVRAARPPDRASVLLFLPRDHYGPTWPRARL